MSTLQQFIPPTISHGRAQQFLRQSYFASAPKDPQATLDTYTSQNYRDLQAGFASSYVKFWGTVAHVDDVSSSDVEGSKNVFRTRWTFVYKNGKKESVRNVNLKLTCKAPWRYVPARECPLDALLLDDSNAGGQDN